MTSNTSAPAPDAKASSGQGIAAVIIGLIFGMFSVLAGFGCVLYFNLIIAIIAIASGAIGLLQTKSIALRALAVLAILGGVSGVTICVVRFSLGITQRL